MHFQAQTITAVTRRDITDFIAAEEVAWWGRLDEIAFLKRVWPDLDERPSTDPRFSSATRDIRQHRQYNLDWDNNWVFEDERLGLRSGPDAQFVEFLCQMLHPIVRSDEAEVRHLLTAFNGFLGADDWEMIEVSQLSGKPIYEGRRREAIKDPQKSLDLDSYEYFGDPQVVREQLRRIDRDLKSDPASAIGSSKELVETVLKTILDDYGISHGSSDDLWVFTRRCGAEKGKSAAELLPPIGRITSAALVCRLDLDEVGAWIRSRSAGVRWGSLGTWHGAERCGLRRQLSAARLGGGAPRDPHRTPAPPVS